MKKIIAILIVSLFLISISAVFAEPNGYHVDCCDSENFKVSRTSIRIGETFIVSFNSLCIPQIMDEDQEDFVDWTNFKIYDGDGNIIESFDPMGPDWPELPADPDIRYEWTYKAVKTGTVVFGMGCGTDCYTIPGCIGDNCEVCNQICNCTKTVTIKSKALPMDWILMKFGLGDKDKE